MKSFVPLLTKLYQYLTLFVVIASPLFFIPNTTFSPEGTYQVTMTVLLACALMCYVATSLITKTWHTVSKLEFFAYGVMVFALTASTVFSRDPRLTLFGDTLSSQSALYLLSFPLVMYLVRTLPEKLRHRAKVVILALLALSVVTFGVLSLFSGTLFSTASRVFGGFSNMTSFAVYLGLFAALLFLYASRASIRTTYKTVLALIATALVVWVVSVGITDTNRPTITSSLYVGGQVLTHEGVFGVGAGQYARAWQLHRPQSIISGPAFSTDFEQGFGFSMTLLATIGLCGFLAFLLLVGSALYSTYRSYQETSSEREKLILGLLFVAVLYFLVVSCVAPLSFALLVTWASLAGLGLARAQLTPFHPSKKMAYILVPAALLYAVFAYRVVQEARAIMVFNQAQTLFSSHGVSSDVDALLSRAETIAPYDGFYRAHVEYMISSLRALVGTKTDDADALQKAYLSQAQRAVDAGIAAVQANRNNYQNYVSLGRAYELAIPFDKENGIDHARKSYEEAIKLYPDNPYLYIMLARLEAAYGSKEGVRVQLTEALKKKQNFADALYLMSQLEASENNINDAIAYAVEAIKNAPNDPLTYVQAGLLFYGKKDYQNAVVTLQTALQKDPNNATIAYFLAKALRDGGRADLAKQIGEELLRRNPTNVDLQTFLRSISSPATSATSTTPRSAKK